MDTFFIHQAKKLGDQKTLRVRSFLSYQRSFSTKIASTDVICSGPWSVTIIYTYVQSSEERSRGMSLAL